MSPISSSSSKSGKNVAQSVIKRSEIQREEDTSDEDELDTSAEEDEESSGLSKESSSVVSNSKTKNGIIPQKKSILKSPPLTSTAVDSSDESDSDDNTKLSAYLAKSSADKSLPASRVIKRKKGTETNVSLCSLMKYLYLVQIRIIFKFIIPTEGVIQEVGTINQGRE